MVVTATATATKIAKVTAGDVGGGGGSSNMTIMVTATTMAVMAAGS